MNHEETDCVIERISMSTQNECEQVPVTPVAVRSGGWDNNDEEGQGSTSHAKLTEEAETPGTTSVSCNTNSRNNHVSASIEAKEKSTSAWKNQEAKRKIHIDMEESRKRGDQYLLQRSDSQGIMCPRNSIVYCAERDGKEEQQVDEVGTRASRVCVAVKSGEMSSNDDEDRARGGNKDGQRNIPDDAKSTEEDAKPGIISMDETVLGSSEATLDRASAEAQENAH